MRAHNAVFRLYGTRPGKVNGLTKEKRGCDARRKHARAARRCYNAARSANRNEEYFLSILLSVVSSDFRAVHPNDSYRGYLVWRIFRRIRTSDTLFFCRPITQSNSNSRGMEITACDAYSMHLIPVHAGILTEKETSTCLGSKNDAYKPAHRLTFPRYVRPS